MKPLTFLASLAVLTVALTANAESLYDIPLKSIDGKDVSLNDYKGKVMLIVNVASKCGKTPQYAQLEELNKEFKKEGLAVPLCEQNLHLAGRLADRALILEKGQVRYRGTMAALMQDAAARRTYLEL